MTDKMKWAVRVSLGLLLALAAFATIAIFTRDRSIKSAVEGGMGALEKLMWENGHWGVPKPPRSDWLPGTVLRVLDDGTCQIFLNDQNTCAEGDCPRTTSDAFLPKIDGTLRTSDSGSAKFLAGANEAQLRGSSKAVISFTAEGVKTVSIELAKLQVAVRRHEDLKTRLLDRNSQLYVITESLRAERIHYKYVGNAETGASGKVGATDQNDATQIIQAVNSGVYEGSGSGEGTTELTVDRPMIIGFKMLRLTALATGNDSQVEPHFQDMSRDEMERVGELPSRKPTP